MDELTLSGLARCEELRFVDSQGHTPMHILAALAPFHIISEVFSVFQTQSNEDGRIFFNKYQKNYDGYTAYDFARSRAKSSSEKEIALLFYKFKTSDLLPLGMYGDTLPPSDKLNNIIDVTIQPSRAATQRTQTISFPPGLGLRTGKLKFGVKHCLKHALICTDYQRFSQPSIFGLSQLKGDLNRHLKPTNNWQWSVQKLSCLNIEKLTKDLCSVSPLNSNHQLLNCVHDLLVLMIIIDDFNELMHPLVSDDHYSLLNFIVKHGHDRSIISLESNHILITQLNDNDHLNDYPYKDDIIYIQLLDVIQRLNLLIPNSNEWKHALHEHFESTIYEKEFIATLSYQLNSANSQNLPDNALFNYFNLLGSRTIGINVIYQIILATQAVNVSTPVIQKWTLILSVLARLSNDAQSGLKEIYSSISHLTPSERSDLWHLNLFQEKIETVKVRLKTYKVNLPPSYAITSAENGNHSIQYGYLSLVSFYAEIFNQLVDLFPTLITELTNSNQRKALCAITHWTIDNQHSIIEWSAQNLNRYAHISPPIN